MTETHLSMCRFCHAHCAIKVDVEEGRAVRVIGDKDNPVYHGYTCAKGRALPEQHAHPERLLHSQRMRSDGTHEAISSDQAIALNNFIEKTVYNNGLRDSTIPRRSDNSTTYEINASAVKVLALLGDLQPIWDRCSEGGPHRL